MSSISIKEQLVQLVQLQGLDTQIYALRREKDEKPIRAKELEDNFNEKKKNLSQLEEKSKVVSLKRKERELELSKKEEDIKKLKVQLYQLKTNKDYSAMLKQIEQVRADGSVLEEEIIKSLDEIDKLKNSITKEQEFLKQEEVALNTEKKKIQDRILEIEEQLKTLGSKRSQITCGIEPKILKHYERILKNRDGLALVSVKNYACQGCFMNTPPQVVNEIQMGQRLVVCEMCARILYLEE
ncbi:MAG: C4-type zinc ribbon domain-containing protein [Candidatus Omnitrophota bacterium]